MERPHIGNYSDPGPEYSIKTQELSALKNALYEVASHWDEFHRQQLNRAIVLAETLHADDRHKDMPYIYHVSRAAVRVAWYLEVDDPDVIIATLLHDSVEDHAAELVGHGQGVEDCTPQELQVAGLQVLEVMFSRRSAIIIAAVTNPPSEQQPDSYEDKLRAYAEKVRAAVVTSEGWLVKFADWCDNGLGIIHDIEGQGGKHAHFKRKYGMVLPILEARFYEDDIQSMLSEPAKAYVRRQFERGRQRLFVPGDAV